MLLEVVVGKGPLFACFLSSFLEPGWTGCDRTAPALKIAIFLCFFILAAIKNRCKFLGRLMYVFWISLLKDRILSAQKGALVSQL